MLPKTYERPLMPALDDEIVIGDRVSRIVSLQTVPNQLHPEITNLLLETEGESGEMTLFLTPNELDWFGSQWFLHPRGYRVAIDSSRESSLLGKWLEVQRYQVIEPDTQIVRYIDAETPQAAVGWIRNLLVDLEREVPDTFTVAPVHRARVVLASRKIVEGVLHDVLSLLSGTPTILDNLPLGSDMGQRPQSSWDEVVTRLSDRDAVEDFIEKVDEAWSELVESEISWGVEGLATSHCGACDAVLFECSCTDGLKRHD